MAVITYLILLCSRKRLFPGHHLQLTRLTFGLASIDAIPSMTTRGDRQTIGHDVPDPYPCIGKRIVPAGSVCSLGAEIAGGRADTRSTGLMVPIWVGTRADCANERSLSEIRAIPTFCSEGAHV